MVHHFKFLFVALVPGSHRKRRQMEAPSLPTSLPKSAAAAAAAEAQSSAAPFGAPQGPAPLGASFGASQGPASTVLESQRRQIQNPSIPGSHQPATNEPQLANHFAFTPAPGGGGGGGGGGSGGVMGGAGDPNGPTGEAAHGHGPSCHDYTGHHQGIFINDSYPRLGSNCQDNDEGQRTKDKGRRKLLHEETKLGLSCLRVFSLLRIRIDNLNSCPTI